jgi:hypothetical protein
MSRLPAPTRDVIYRAVDGGAVLLCMTDEVYYGLNAVGSYIWEHLPPALETFEELCTALQTAYPDVPEQTIRADARALLDDLLANGLVIAPAPTAATNELLTAGESVQPASTGVG